MSAAVANDVFASISSFLSTAKTEKLAGIYNLEGDALTICWSAEIGGLRSKESNPSKGVSLTVYKREKR